jgi:hypothetical protein
VNKFWKISPKGRTSRPKQAGLKNPKRLETGKLGSLTWWAQTCIIKAHPSRIYQYWICTTSAVASQCDMCRFCPLLLVRLLSISDDNVGLVVILGLHAKLLRQFIRNLNKDLIKNNNNNNNNIFEVVHCNCVIFFRFNFDSQAPFCTWI